MAELKAKGLLEKAEAFARTLGEEQMSGQLAQSTMLKVKRAQLEALGASEQEIEAELNAMQPAASFSGLPTAIRGIRTTGTVHNLTLLISFADIPAPTAITRPKMEANIYGQGTEVAQNHLPFNSMAQYYLRASQNKFNVTGKALGWFQFFSTRDSRTPQMTGNTSADNLAKNQGLFDLVTTALRFYDANEDYAIYDNDNDGVIDNIDIIWTGPPGAWMSFWWNYKWSFFVPDQQTFMVDGKRIRNFTWNQLKLRENGTDYDPRVLIHEFGHVLGLPDLYDYERRSTVGVKGGVGGMDMMDSNIGNLNGFSRWMLGWIEPQIIAAGEPRMVTLNASGDVRTDLNKAVVIFPNLTSTPLQEFFLIENRWRMGNDSFSGMPGNGLAIWHVDGTLNASGTNFNANNTNRNRTAPGGNKLVRLVQADGLEQIENHQWTAADGTIFYGGRADAGDYYTAGGTFGPGSMPNSNTYAGTPTNIIVDTISANGPVMTARVGFFGGAPPPNMQPGPQAQQTLSDNTAATGGSVNLQGSVENSGSGDAGAFRVSFYASLDEVIRADEDILLGAYDVSGVIHETTMNFAQSLTIPAGTQPGSYRIGWVIDSQGVIPEAAENDNVFVLPDVFTVTGPRLPEIVVEGIAGEISDGRADTSAEEGTLIGPVRVGRNVLQLFTIRNAGLEALTLGPAAVAITGAGAAHFEVTAQPPATLPAGSSAAFALAFSPTTAGLHAAEVVISSDDFNEGTYNFRIEGRALTATDDHGDDVTVATTLALSAPLSGVIDLGGDVDVFKLTVLTGGQLTVTSSGTADTAAALLNATGELIVHNDDHGNSMAFALASNVTPGVYYLVVSGASAFDSGSYSVTATLTASGGPDDHGNTTATATVVAPGAAESGRLDYAGDVDVFRLTLPAAGTLILQSTGETNTFLTFKDQSGTLLNTADTGAEFGNFQLVRFANAGIYYAEISGGSADSEGDYGLITSFIAGTPPDDHGDAIAEATAISPDSADSGTFEESGDVDVFRVILPTAGRLAMHTGGPLNPLLELRDSSGTLLLSDADSGPGDNAQAVTLLSAGTYYLHLSGFDPGLTGSYRLYTNFTPNAIALADDHNELPDTGTALSEGIGSAVAGNLSVAGDTDFFRITITQNGFLQVLSTGPSDTDGALFDSKGVQLLADDDSGVSTNFLLPAAVTPGTYYARVRGYQGVSTGAYSVYYSFTSGAIPDDHGGTTSTSTLASVPGTASGIINVGGDVDVFRITLAGPGSLRMFTQGLTDTVGELWNANGDILSSADDASITNSNFDLRSNVSPGTYYLAVKGYDFAITGAYTLNLEFTGTAAVAPVIALGASAVIVPLAAGSNDQASLELRNSGGGTLTYTLTPSASWIHLASSTGSSTGEWDTIDFTVDADELPAGATSVGSIQITAPGAVTRTVLVSAIVAAAIPALPQPAITITPGGASLQIQWEGQSGRFFHLETSDTLAPGSWVRVPDVVSIGSGTASFTLPISSGITKRFYRLVLDN